MPDRACTYNDDTWDWDWNKLPRSIRVQCDKFCIKNFGFWQIHAIEFSTGFTMIVNQYPTYYEAKRYFKYLLDLKRHSGYVIIEVLEDDRYIINWGTRKPNNAK